MKPLLERKRFQHDTLEDQSGSWGGVEEMVAGDTEGQLREDPLGNLTSSSTKYPNTHMPVLDFDFPCRLIPSRTKGHWHLYIDMQVNWPALRNVLLALADAKIIQKGYADACIERRMTLVRTEGTFEPHSIDEHQGGGDDD